MNLKLQEMGVILVSFLLFLNRYKMYKRAEKEVFNKKGSNKFANLKKWPIFASSNNSIDRKSVV